MLAKAETLPFHTLKCQDIETPLAFSQSFDALICVGVLDFINNVDSLIIEFSKCLQQVNFIALTMPETPNESMNAFTELEVKALFRRCGFTLLKCDKIVGYTDSENNQSVFYWAILMQFNGGNK